MYIVHVIITYLFQQDLFFQKIIHGNDNIPIHMYTYMYSTHVI